jgi:hypothetical protein
MFLLLLIVIFWLAVAQSENGSLGQIIFWMIVIYLILLVLF